MFDIWHGDFNIATAVFVFSVAVLLPLQLFLCFKVKPLKIRLIPVGLCTLLVAAMALLAIYKASISEEWGAIGFIILAVLAAFMLVICGVGWLIWAIISRKARVCYLIGAITFAVLTFMGGAHIIHAHGRTSPGYAVVPMLFTLAFAALYRSSKK